MAPEAYIETAAKSFADALRGPEGREGLAAFAEKRAPSWAKDGMSARFSSVLIANRGEIACRIIRAARAEGLRAVAVFSDADAEALHVRLADAAVRIGAAAAGAVLPVDPEPHRGGEGDRRRSRSSGLWLSRRERRLRRSLRAAGLVFVGPPPAAIRAMGDKSAAKARMAAAGVPCAPGYHGDDQSPARFAAEAERIGYPVMVKASAGGGGRGMRIVRDAGRRSRRRCAPRAPRRQAHSATGG